jgi:acetoin:2,6-dichlorophenolindophenol oxidoreductase subunit alpha
VSVTPAGTTAATRPADDRAAWLRTMIEIRLFEEKVQELFMQGQIQGTTHLCQGQEAVCVGATAALEDRDYLTITYRGHGHALARGVSMDAAFGELMGLKNGCCGGVGGSMHFTDFSLGLIGAFAIIGPSFSVALGAALSSRMQGKDCVALGFCGDGATNIGTFHESLNMAAVWKAPVVFVVENNLYGEYSPLLTTTALEDIAERAKGYGIPGVIVDGQDVDAVYAATSAAVARARAGEGPSLLEMKTYRYRGHSRTDPAKYRKEGELEEWKQRDPIDLLGAKLVAENVASAEELQQWHDEVQAEVDATAVRAAEASVPTFEEIEGYVYASRA